MRPASPRGRFARAAAACVLAGLGLSAARCSASSEAPPRLYAAASVGAAAESLSAARGDAPLDLVLAATSTLARQIEEGAPPGCFLGADARWADHLEAAGVVEPGTRIDLLSNRLVVIAPAGTKWVLGRLDELADRDLARIALADPDSVPAGRYAKEALYHVDVWEALAPRVVGCTDVRAAAALVAAGEVDAGIVYATDARAPGLRVVHAIDPQLHPAVAYPLLLVKDAPPAARELWEWLQTEPALAAFRDAGFTRLRR